MELVPCLPPLAAGLLTLFILYQKWKPRRTQNSPPEPAGAWPLIGHLLQLNVQKPLARTLAAMADKYGPVFTIRLGMMQVLVVSNWEAVKECFTTNDKIFSSRPPSSFGAYLHYNHAGFGLAPHGPYWRQMRKIAIQELLSAKRMEKIRHVRVSEIDASIKGLFSIFNKMKDGNNSPVKVDMSNWFEDLSLNMILRKIGGRRYYFDSTDNGKRRFAHFKEVVKEHLRFSEQFIVSDVIPFPLLRLLDLQWHIRSMKRIAKELDTILQIWIDEHDGERSINDEQDFIDGLLSIIEDGSIYGHSREIVIKATILILIVAGFGTTTIHLTWILSVLLKNQHVMSQAQEEIDAKVGKKRWVEESDIKNLVYLQAIVKETFRLYPPGPLALPRQAAEDCYVSGYFIPKGTHLFVNVWKLHRDPRTWPEPDKFLPERFLSSQRQKMAETDVSSQNLEFSFGPFGFGRRICPGIPFTDQVTHLTIARLIQGFDFSTPSNLPVDMTESLAFTMSKTTPLEVQIMPRLPNDALHGEERFKTSA